MNRKEKKLYEKIKDIYNSMPNAEKKFNREEQLAIARWITIGILNKNAFSDTTAGSDSHKTYIQNLDYPFTPFGESEYQKNWYINLQNSIVATIIRDILIFISFLASLYLTFLQIIEK